MTWGEVSQPSVMTWGGVTGVAKPPVVPRDVEVPEVGPPSWDCLRGIIIYMDHGGRATSAVWLYR